MKLYLDTDSDETHTVINIQDIAVSGEKTMVFLQEFIKMYNSVGGKK